MANKSLTDLTARTATADSDLIHVNSGGTDYKETKANFLSNITSSISSINSSLSNLFTTEKKASGTSHTISANSNGRIDIPVSKSGYIAIGLAGFDVKNGGLSVINVDVSIGTSTVTIWVKNTTTSSITISDPTVTVLYRTS